MGSILGSVLGSVLGLEWAKMRQDDSNEDIKSLKVPKNIIFKKCDFTIGKQYFSRLGGSQEEYERFRKAPKRHLKSFKTSKKGSKNGTKTQLFLDHFWSSFGTPNWPQHWLEMGPRRDPKRIHIHITCILKFT